MPSALRTTASSSISKPATFLQQKQKMTLSQTYYLAHAARGKLSKEAAKADHDLRLLVGHANLLDGLMLDLSQAEREQESWFNQTVKGASTTSTQSSPSDNDRHVRWAGESLPAVTEDYEDDSDDESVDDAEETIARPQTLIIARRTFTTTAIEDDDDEDMAEDPEEDEAELRLTRTPSHSSPPELMEESDSESASDSDMPGSKSPCSRRRTMLSTKTVSTYHNDKLHPPLQSTDCGSLPSCIVVSCSVTSEAGLWAGRLIS